MSVNCLQKSASYMFSSMIILSVPRNRAPSSARTNRNPVVRLRGRRIVLRRDADEPAAALHAFDHPVRFRHLVLDEVLAPARVQFGETHVGQGRYRRSVRRTRKDAPDAGPRARYSSTRCVHRPLCPGQPSGYRHPAGRDSHCTCGRTRFCRFGPRAAMPGRYLKVLDAAALHGLDHLRRIALLAQPPRARLHLNTARRSSPALWPSTSRRYPRTRAACRPRRGW